MNAETKTDNTMEATSITTITAANVFFLLELLKFIFTPLSILFAVTFITKESFIMFFQILGFFLAIFALVSLISRKGTRQDKDKIQSFWKRESQANLTPAQDISQLDYIDLSNVTLPFAMFPDEELKQYEQQVLDLRDQKILNLNGISNTELKLQYGAANLGILTRYDQNFILLVRTLNQWGHRLYEISQPKEAKTVLLFAVSIGSDIKATYELLLKIYLEDGERAGIENLKSSAEKLSSIRKDSILAMLNEA